MVISHVKLCEKPEIIHRIFTSYRIQKNDGTKVKGRYARFQNDDYKNCKNTIYSTLRN